MKRAREKGALSKGVRARSETTDAHGEQPAGGDTEASHHVSSDGEPVIYPFCLTVCALEHSLTKDQKAIPMVPFVAIGEALIFPFELWLWIKSGEARLAARRKR